MDNRSLKISLLSLRWSVFLVFLVWSGDKFLRPEHVAGVFQHFYFIPGIQPVISYLIGAAELAIAVAFVLGLQKTASYGVILVLHAISTLSCYKQYLAPYAEAFNILLFAAWPMLAACLALFLLRNEDTLLTLSSGKK